MLSYFAYILYPISCSEGEALDLMFQAVQWIEEKRVCNGMDMVVTAKHDTYGITFEVKSNIVLLIYRHLTSHASQDEQYSRHHNQ